MYDTLDNKKASILLDGNSYTTASTKPIKQCYCIGADKCTDITCRLVKDYLNKL